MSRELESQFRILSVEDNPADVVLLQTAIDECAFHGNVRFCDSHEKAKSILLTESFDLLLSDLGTDREAAWSFIRSVRSMHPSLPIVILTGGSNPLPAYE
ncbi:MAG TPA: response regulator, partial [Edaphobacter sp.]|nr:response regulator [Edaphobacter sp.]